MESVKPGLLGHGTNLYEKRQSKRKKKLLEVNKGGDAWTSKEGRLGGELSSSLSLAKERDRGPFM